MAFAIMRVNPLSNKSRGKNSVGGSIRHLDHHKECAEISKPELSHLNRSLTSADFHKRSFKECKELALDLKEKHNKAVDEWNENNPDKEKRHLKENTNQFFEAVFSFSPEAQGKFSIKEWCNQTLAFIKEEFIKKGCIPIRAQLDMDEETPHIHFIGAAFDNQKQNCTTRNILGDRANLCLMQDKYAQKVEQFGLERGYSRYREYQALLKRAEKEGLSVKEYSEKYNVKIPTKRNHKSIREWKAEQQAIGMMLERKNKELSDSYENLCELKDQLIRDYEIPDKYIKALQKVDTYEALLNIGEQLMLTVDGKEISLTDMLWECREQDWDRLEELQNENYYDDLEL